MIYLDTSVLVPYYCPEPNSEAVEEIIMEAGQPAISKLTEVELASAVSGKIREQNLSQTDGNRIMAEFQSHIGQNLFLMIPVRMRHSGIRLRNLMNLFSHQRSAGTLVKEKIDLTGRKIGDILVITDLGEYRERTRKETEK